MDHGEPRKKTFKARKTMKISDRQQLEVVHKAKQDDVLKSITLTLENGNYDANMNFVYNGTTTKELKGNLNDIDLNRDSHHSVMKLTDLESLIHDDHTSDLNLPVELDFSECIKCPKDTCQFVTSVNVVQDYSKNNGQFDQKLPNLDILPTVENPTYKTECLEQQVLPNIYKEKESCKVLENIYKSVYENPDRHIDRLLENHNTNAEKETEETFDRGTADSYIVKKDVSLNGEYAQNEANSKNLLDNEMQNAEDSEKEHKPQENLEFASSPHAPNILPVMAEPEIISKENLETVSPQQDVGEEAISSIMENIQNVKNKEQKYFPAESSFGNPVSDLQTVSGLESLDTMDTDEIIPILEKLAPLDGLQNFSNTNSLSDCLVDTEEEKHKNNKTSSSKNDVCETQTMNASLVLSDQEDLCGPSTLTRKNILKDHDASEVIADEQLKPEKEQEKYEKSDHYHLKRSKSEDLDRQSSKRRRLQGKEYEAELQVKIKAEDLNKKLQKVIQKMFEEKLTALQCIDFDKAIADLKTRVELIECKKHETILHSMQAKITKLTKRCGAAKEDLKKRLEQTSVTQPISSVTSASNDPFTTANSMTYRSSGTVRQMLESKQNVGETTTASVQSSSAEVRTSNATQMPVNHYPVTTSLQTRAPPDWKLIQQKINASSTGSSQNNLSNQSKPIPPVTFATITTSAIPSPSTATVIGNNQVSTSSNQSTIPSLPFILHVPVALPSQPQLLQGTTGTLVTNKKSGNVGFIAVQNQSTVGSLSKTPVSLPVTKAISNPTMTNPGIQRNCPAASVPNTLNSLMEQTVQPITLQSRSSLPTVMNSGIHSQASNQNPTPKHPTVGNSGIHSQASNPNPTPMHPVTGFNKLSSSVPPSGNRFELQTSRTQPAEITSSKFTLGAACEKAAGGVIDLTMDDEGESQDSKRTKFATVSGSVQPTQQVARQVQALQSSQQSNKQTSTGLSSQATIHVLPTAQTTVNITQNLRTQTPTQASAPRATNNPHMVYNPTVLPSVPAQTQIRHMQGHSMHKISPHNGGLPIRMPQATAHVVNNNGMPITSTGPQHTAHHWPHQETARPIHPAPLPEAPQPPCLSADASLTSAPQKPHLKLARVQSQNGIVLSWSVLEIDRNCAAVDSYHLYAYHEDPTATSPSQWKKIGEVKALPLPMACTLTQFVSGSKYYFAVRAKDVHGRFGPFCDPQSTDVISTQSS